MLRSLLGFLLGALCLLSSQGFVNSGGDELSMRYRATTIIVQNPEEAREFFVKYFGAKRLKQQQFITQSLGGFNADTTGVRFLYSQNSEFFDIYFFKREEPEVTEFQSLLERIHR